MSHSSRRGKRVWSVFCGVSVLALASTASATGPFVLQLAPGVGGPVADKGQPLKNAGPGNEQPTVTTLIKNGKQYVVTIYMSSNVDDNLRPNQCKCSSIELTASGPQIVADQVLLTQHANTDRPCNHPFAISDGTNYVVWGYGYAQDNNSQTQSYAQVLDEMCQKVTDKVRVSQDANDNQGAPELAWAGGGYITYAYYDNNANRTYYRQLMLTSDANGVSLAPQNDSQTIVTPSNIGRPAVAQSGDYSLICAAKGDQRPPEDGVACAYVNAKTGQVMWSNMVIAQSDPANHIYFNQPSVATLSPGRFALQVIQSTGNGKNTNTKGGSLVHLFVLEPTDTDPGVKGHYDKGLIGSYQTHSAIISGQYGTNGSPFIGLYEAPITGNGVPLLTLFDYDSAAEQFHDPDVANNQWVLGPTKADSGYLSNIYGQNPNDQGRDFMRAIADVPNPGAGVQGGFMPTVKTFFVLPYDGRLDMDPKNALFLSFIPGYTTVPVPPSTPPIIGGGEGTINPNPTTAGSTGSGAGPGSGSGGSFGEDPTLKSETQSGCACTTAGDDTRNTGALLAALGIALLGVSRRRARS